jgi:rhodanese-related sulfurtransferase
VWFRRIPSITPEQAIERQAVGELVLVDVREPVELRGGRVGGAVNIPLRELPARLQELDRKQPVAFLCRSGARSASAARLASKAGYDAVNVRGGVGAWTRGGSSLTQ